MDKKKKIDTSCLLVTGNYGIGKSISIECLLKSLGYEIKTIDFSKFQKISPNEFIDKIFNSNIVTLFGNSNNNNQKENKKKVLVIDQIETLITKPEHLNIMAMIEKNDVIWKMPIILISVKIHNKIINNIKKKTQIINFYDPFKSDLEKVLNKIIKSENIKFENKNMADLIIDFCKSDYRKMINILQDMITMYKMPIISRQNLISYISSSKKKDLEFDLFTVSKLLLYEYVGIKDILKYYEIDVVNLPLMMLEHYTTGINCYKPEDSDGIGIAVEIINSISKGDIIDNFVYGNQIWNIQDAYGYYSCVYPSYILNERLEGDENTITTYTDKGDIVKKTVKERNYEIHFPHDPNRTSIKKINKKNIIQIKHYIKNIDINDLFDITNIISQLYYSGRYDEFIKLLQSYNLPIKSFNKLLGIDKISDSKNKITFVVNNKNIKYENFMKKKIKKEK